MTIKDVIKQVLKNACREATERVREKEDKKESKRTFDRDERLKIKAAVNAIGWTGSTEDQILRLLSLITKAPELAKSMTVVVDVLSVIVLEAKGSNHGYGVGVPLISTTSNIGNANKSIRALDISGTIDSWQWDCRDNPRHATDEEIDQCIENLTDRQWDTIKVNPLFKSIMDKSLGVVVEVGPESGGPEVDEVKTEEGRTISVKSAA